MTYKLTLDLHFFTYFRPNPVNFIYTTRLSVSQKLYSLSPAFTFAFIRPKS